MNKPNVVFDLLHRISFLSNKLECLNLETTINQAKFQLLGHLCFLMSKQSSKVHKRLYFFLSVILQSVSLLNDILVNVIMPEYLDAKCHYTECHLDERHGTAK